jgi:hypothetical protein
MNYWNNFLGYEWVLNRKNLIKQFNSPDTGGPNLKSLHEGGVTYADKDFDYRFNSLGFRSAEFTNNHPVKILYAGCSLTEGIGLPIEHMWGSFVNDEISKHIGKPIPLLNIGIGGLGADAITRFVFILIENNFQPDMVCILLPSVLRQEVFTVDEWGRGTFVNYVPKYCGNSIHEKRVFNLVSQLTNYYQRFIDQFRNLLLLKYYLKSRNIPFFFGCWDNFQFEDDVTHKVTSYEQIMAKYCHRELKEHYVEGHFTYDKDAQRLGVRDFIFKFPQQIGRDLGHFGPNSHYSYARSFFDAIQNRDSFKNMISILKDRQ